MPSLLFTSFDDFLPTMICGASRGLFTAAVLLSEICLGASIRGDVPSIRDPSLAASLSKPLQAAHAAAAPASVNFKKLRLEIGGVASEDVGEDAGDNAVPISIFPVLRGASVGIYRASKAWRVITEYICADSYA